MSDDCVNWSRNGAQNFQLVTCGWTDEWTSSLRCDDDDVLPEHLKELKEEDSRNLLRLSSFNRAQVSKPLHSFNRMSESISFQSDSPGLIAWTRQNPLHLRRLFLFAFCVLLLPLLLFSFCSVCLGRSSTRKMKRNPESERRRAK